MADPNPNIPICRTFQPKTNNIVAVLDSNGIPKKKRGPMQLLKVTKHMLRRRNLNSKSADFASDETWKCVLRSMRPLRMQNDRPPVASVAPCYEAVKEHFEEVSSPPLSQMGTMWPLRSRCVSADNLQELDLNHKGREDGDGTIDAKAEEFISKFYEQMRLQRSDSTL